MGGQVLRGGLGKFLVPLLVPGPPKPTAVTFYTCFYYICASFVSCVKEGLKNLKWWILKISINKVTGNVEF